MADQRPVEQDREGPSDPALLKRVVRRDRKALEALYDRYSRQVYSLSLRMVENQSQAEEITQDVFMTVWSRGQTYHSERGPFSAWLMSVAHNRCIDELRKRRRRARYPTQDIDNLRVEPSGNSEEVADAVFNLLDREEITEALNKLPPPQKQVIVMAYFQGLTQSEISQALSTPLGTVKTRMRLGLQKMRDLMTV